MFSHEAVLQCCFTCLIVSRSWEIWIVISAWMSVCYRLRDVVPHRCRGSRTYWFVVSSFIGWSGNHIFAVVSFAGLWSSPYFPFRTPRLILEHVSTKASSFAISSNSSDDVGISAGLDQQGLPRHRALPKSRFNDNNGPSGWLSTG